MRFRQSDMAPTEKVFLVVSILFAVAAANFDANMMCPLVKMPECPSVTSSNGDVIQYIPKLLPSHADDIGYVSDQLADVDSATRWIKKFRCVKPACLSNPCSQNATCHETDEGFRCSCPDGYYGDTCEEDAFIKFLYVLKEETKRGLVPFSSRSSPMAFQLAESVGWTQNISHLVCKHAGYKAAYATYSGGVRAESPHYDFVTTASIICPPSATNISECWHGNRSTNGSEEAVKVVCCPVDRYGPPGVRCGPPGAALGMENGSIPGSALSSSSCYSARCAEKSRLNGAQSWDPSYQNTYQWIKISMETNYVITGVITQGRPDAERWVTSYKVSYSRDNSEWISYLDEYSGTVKIFPGNYDRSTLVTHVFWRAIVARYFRIHPQNWYDRISLRCELIGYGPLSSNLEGIVNGDGRCTPSKGDPLGMEDRRIPDSSITSSTYWNDDSGHRPFYGRLNQQSSPGTAGAWVAKHNDPDKWMKVDLGTIHTVTGIISQGRSNNQWVTSLQVSYSRNGDKWTFVGKGHCGERIIYPANFDQETHVTIMFPEPVTARYVRVHIVTYSVSPSIRIEVLGYI